MSELNKDTAKYRITLSTGINLHDKTKHVHIQNDADLINEIEWYASKENKTDYKVYRVVQLKHVSSSDLKKIIEDVDKDKQLERLLSLVEGKQKVIDDLKGEIENLKDRITDNEGGEE